MVELKTVHKKESFGRSCFLMPQLMPIDATLMPKDA